MLTTALLISRTEAGFGGDLLRDTHVAELLRDVGKSMARWWRIAASP